MPIELVEEMELRRSSWSVELEAEGGMLAEEEEDGTAPSFLSTMGRGDEELQDPRRVRVLGRVKAEDGDPVTACVAGTGRDCPRFGRLWSSPAS